MDLRDKIYFNPASVFLIPMMPDLSEIILALAIATKNSAIPQ